MNFLSTIKSIITKSGVMTIFYTLADRSIIAYSVFLLRISPVLYSKKRFRDVYGRNPDFKKPVTFNEKLLWLMLYWRHPLKTQCADKYTLRSYVNQNGWGHILPELLGVYENSSEINFDVLPEKFVLKCSHGSGFNIVCRNKATFDTKEATSKLNTWMKKDYSKYAGEVHYAEMKPRIICEEFLEDLDKELPVDYKVYCFDGKAHCTLIVQDRSLTRHQAVYDFYDREWIKLPYSKSSLKADRNVPKPEAYNEIIEAAEALSKPFPFVRMDFYDIKGKAVLGEMTFTPQGCICSGNTDLAQMLLGELIVLPPPVRSQKSKKNMMPL
jgi:hypothetical protein